MRARMDRYDDRALWLARFVLPHEPALRAWLLRRQVAGLEVDDVVQDTYARLSTAANVESVRNPRSYMFRTAYSVIADHLRHNQVVEMHSFAQFESEEFVADEPSPEQIAGDREELIRLGEAIAGLPDGERQVLMLRRIDELPQRAVAERLGISESNVEKRMGRAIRRLADALGRGRKSPARPSREHRERNEAR